MKKLLTPPVVKKGDPGALTVEQLKAVMPARQKANITQALVTEVNSIAIEPEYREHFRENLVSFTSVLNDPTSTLPGYIKAVRYVGYKLMGMTNQESWLRTFPERYQRLVDENAESKYIRSLVCAYNKGQLVNRILEQTLVPTWILNADKLQEAINVQAMLMTHAKSEKVRSDAANSILTHLKQPEAAKVSIDINVKEDQSIKELKDAMVRLAVLQQETIKGGQTNAQQVAEGNIIDSTSERVE